MDYGIFYVNKEESEKVVDATKLCVSIRIPSPSPYFKPEVAL